MIPPEPGGRPLRALERAQDPAVEKVEGSFLGVESDGPLDFRERLGELSFANEHQGQVRGEGGARRQERRTLAVGERGLFEAAVTLGEDRSREETLDALLREEGQQQDGYDEHDDRRGKKPPRHSIPASEPVLDAELRRPLGSDEGIEAREVRGLDGEDVRLQVPVVEEVERLEQEIEVSTLAERARPHHPDVEVVERRLTEREPG